MDLKDRIKQFCDSISLSIREFERACGLTRGNISNMTGALGSDKLAKIIDAYPELNLYWLVTGNGPMLRSDGPPPQPESSVLEHENALLKRMLAEKDAEIRLLNREVGALEGRPSERPGEAPARFYATKPEVPGMPGSCDNPHVTPPAIKEHRAHK